MRRGALRAFTDAVAHPRAAHADRTDAGHDLALWQMAVAHQPLAAIIGRLVGVPTEQGRDFGLDSLRLENSFRGVKKNIPLRLA
jgi:hypothetical protein